MEFLWYIIAGGAVGFAVGLTGVGGGSLMTPLLLLFGFSPPVAIGTDLLYAGITKSSGVWFHHRFGNIKWSLMLWLAAGSLPVSVCLSLYMRHSALRSSPGFEELLTAALGVMLIVTSVVIALQSRIQNRLIARAAGAVPASGLVDRHRSLFTLLTGALLGLCVTLSSVGAGAFGAALLFLLYPRLHTREVVGTDIAHAVPLTLVAGLGYLFNGLVDFMLLFALLCGSLPGIWLGSHMGTQLPEKLMRGVLAVLLFGLGLNFSLGFGH